MNGTHNYKVSPVLRPSYLVPNSAPFWKEPNAYESNLHSVMVVLSTPSLTCPPPSTHSAVTTTVHLVKTLQASLWCGESSILATLPLGRPKHQCRNLIFRRLAQIEN
ncbi:hypothetical protein KAX17_00405, partial [Candidatus Bipolaricaulota bacterium]|nr:hypothetical protein [Candidatus Bipolaricaulota bacterium]